MNAMLKTHARSRFGLALAVGVVSIVVAPALARAAEWYVSPSGSDSAAGTMAAPFATLSKANSAAAAGDTIWVRGGTYHLTTQLVLSKSGTSDTNRTKFWAYTGETPVLDASMYVTSNAAVDVPVVLVTGNWMHLRGLEIGNAKVGASGDHSYSLLRTKNASNNTFELLNIHNGFGPGLFVDTGMGGNLILNCDSHDNYDVNGSQGDGQNGDGFGVHYQKTGPSTIIRGCRAWNNSDDGYDFISQEVPITIEGCFATGMGRGSAGNGNGFKIGSSLTGIRHIVQNNVAWKNKDSGFYANHSTGGNTWYNNTSYMNGTQYNMLASSFDSSGNVTGTITLTGSKVHIMRNNVGFPNKNANMTGVDTANNTWDLNITEASTDFASTSDTGCTGPREADGSMPSACTFLHLKAGSPLIDKGVDVGLPFVGAEPDLGAYEYGATTTTGTGGTGGSTGGTGAAGTNGAGGSTTGTGGRGGSSAAAGTSGSGTAGAGGRAGTTGTTGTGGTSSGSAGTIGGSGSAGTSGAAGVSGGTGGTTVVGTGGSLGTGTGGSNNTGTAGTSPSGAAGTSPSGAAGSNATGAGGSMASGNAGTTGETGGASGGCACAFGPAAAPRGNAAWTLVAVLGVLVLRRRRRAG
jgi:MYXO-CTERM domain-containing protein